MKEEKEGYYEWLWLFRCYSVSFIYFIDYHIRGMDLNKY